MEYSVAYAEAQLLGAITLFLSESVIDSAKALYKLRKAFQTFDEVNKQLTSSNLKSTLSSGMASSTPNLSFTHTGNIRSQSSSASLKPNGSKSGLKDNGIISLESLKNPEIAARAKKFQQARMQRANLLTGGESDRDLISQAISDLSLDTNKHKRAGQDTVDEYITSAINACYGLLQLVISIIPPGLGRVLSIVGFYGDKEEGLTKLWKATSHINIHGSIALLALLQFYDGPTQVSGFNPTRTATASPEVEDFGDNPIPTDVSDLAQTKKCLRIALTQAREHYSKGPLWQLQEGRMKASEGKLREAVAIMDDTSRGPINLRQVEGLMLFDKTMFIVSLHGYETAAPNFLQLIELSSWSHMFYTYLSGISQVEIYRANKVKDPKKANEALLLAKACFEKSPSYMSKRKILSRPMPFDTFVLRKLNQWKEAVATKRISFVDAIGTSPAHEVIYFWNGFGRMPQEELERSLEILEYSATAPLKEIEDEEIIRHLLTSVVLRHLNRVEEGYELLKSKVLPKIYHNTPAKGYYKSGIPKVTFNRKHRDPWVAPSAIYEMAVFEWTLHGSEKISLVRDYLEMANSWGDDFELSTRVGLKIKSALSRLEDVSQT